MKKAERWSFLPSGLSSHRVFLPSIQDIDEKILVGPVDEDTVHKPEKMAYIGVLCILDIVLDGLTFFNGDVQTCGI